MTANLVIWKWAEDLADAKARRKRKLKVSEAAELILHDSGDVLTSPFPQQPLIDAIDAAFPAPEDDRPFVVECYPQRIVVNVTMASRIEVISVIGPLANRLGFNAAEA
ncbi:hypothetical protein RMSM_02522 [Rhodopirellula maiorica SM1]|uniref:Uncharacterized protein n=1 Tax=Rhodopirellula maiorica SM1 TaxID=1265738 RepID=M5RMX2_9BACT|nr:hypothetical protein [Rhodopirellula maiorica]EMI20556.1 hypothetical protein RMSM_02522 [Rhodopirellula maiorica SM1]